MTSSPKKPQTQAPDQIGNITVPVPVQSGATFPLISDYGYGMVQDWKIVEHRFGELATMGVQRFGVGSGATHFQFVKSVLTYTDRQDLLDFYDLVQGSFASFTYPVPNADRTTFTNYEVVFDTPPVSITDLSNRAQTGLSFTEIISPANAPTVSITEVDSRFPSSALATALASEVQMIIPLVHIKVRDTSVPDIYFSDRRINVEDFPGAPTSPYTFLPRLLGIGVPGTGDVIMSQSIDGRAENIRLIFGNADRAMSQLTCNCSIDFAQIDLSFLHVGTGILLQLWKGIIVSWQIDGSSQMSVQCSDGLYPITQTYPPRVVSRQCWKPFNQDVLPGYRPCPWSTIGNGQGNASSCDYFFNTPNGCLSHGMSNYFGGHPEQPQSVLIQDNGTGIIGGFFRTMVVSTSILSDSIWGNPLPEIWCNDMGSPQRAFWAECMVAAVRNESDFYDLLGIVGAGPLGAYEGMSVQTNAEGYKWVVAPTADGFYPQGFSVNGNLNITGYHPELGLRQSVGYDPALLAVNAFQGQDAFSLGQGSPQDWAERMPGTLSNLPGNPGWAIPYAAGTAVCEIRYPASAGKGLVPTTAEAHTMQCPIREGLTASIWDANGNWSAFPGCINPFWIAANTYLRALSLAHADPATQLSYLVLSSITNAQGMGAADIAALWVTPLVGTTLTSFQITAAGKALPNYNLDYYNGTFTWGLLDGSPSISISLSQAITDGYVQPLNTQPNQEPQFMFQGMLGQSKPFRDWMNEIMNCCLGYWCFEFGQLKLGCRYNAVPVDAFTVGSMLYQSLTITPLVGAFEYLKVMFANVELQYQQDIAEYEDKDHAIYFGRAATPLTSNMNSAGVSTLSQGLRVATTRVREECGGIYRNDLSNPYTEYDQNKRVSFKSTLLALNSEIGQVISVTHPDLATYPGAQQADGGPSTPYEANTWPFRIKKWMLHSDWSVSIMADSCVDSMYDLEVGPVPTAVQPAPLPVMFYPEPLGQWAPAQVQADPNDALWPSEYNFNLGQSFSYRGDGTLLTSAVVAGLLPVNQFIPNCGAPNVKSGNVSWSATAGGFIPGGTTLFVQICMAQWNIVPTVPVVMQYSPPSEILVLKVPPGADVYTITISDIVWPNSSLQNLGWVLFANGTEDLICGQFAGLGLPTSITFSGPILRQTYGVPDYDLGTLRLQAQELIHGGVVGGGVYALTSTTIVSPEVADLSGQDNWAGRALAIIGRQQGDGIAPWSAFNITAYAPLTGTFTVDRDPTVTGVNNTPPVAVGDVFVVCTLGVDNSANPYVITDPGLSNATNVPPFTGEMPNDPNRVGQMIRVIKGTSRGMSAKIVSNTPTSYTLGTPLPIDATSVWVLTTSSWPYSQNVNVNNANPSATTVTNIAINNYAGLALLVEGVTVDDQSVVIDDTDACVRMLYIPGVQGTTNVAS